MPLPCRAGVGGLVAPRRGFLSSYPPRGSCALGWTVRTAAVEQLAPTVGHRHRRSPVRKVGGWRSGGVPLASSNRSAVANSRSAARMRRRRLSASPSAAGRTELAKNAGRFVLSPRSGSTDQHRIAKPLKLIVTQWGSPLDELLTLEVAVKFGEIEASTPFGTIRFPIPDYMTGRSITLVRRDGSCRILIVVNHKHGERRVRFDAVRHGGSWLVSQVPDQSSGRTS